MTSANWLEKVTERLIPTSLGLVNVGVGGRADGQAMVFWPSLMMDGTMWQYQYEHFAPDYRIVLVAIFDELGIGKCVLVGNSWGGMLAGVFPAYYPERTAAAVGINAAASLPAAA
jgi:3-oxoadipate enol-lactonase